MFRILTTISVFMLIYVMPVFAAPITKDEAVKGIAKGILGLFTLVIISIIISIGFLILIWKIFVKIWFKEKTKHEAKKETKPTAPNTTEKPKYEPIDFRKK